MRISDWSSDVCSSDLEVVVKVLRPGIERQIAADIALLKNIAGLVDRTHPSADKIRPREIVAEIESTLAAELDLQREGANASVLRRFWEGSDDLYVPEPIWRSEEPTSELQSLMRISYAVFCLKKKTKQQQNTHQ